MSNSKSQHVRDEEITGAVRRAISHDSVLGLDDLTVSVQDGVVLLKGTVQTAAERAAAEYDARVPGVARVDNCLTVVSDEATDSDLESAVDQSLAENTSLARNIDGEVRSGRVTLTGQVEDLVEARKAVHAAEEVPGIFAVEDDLSISAPGREAPFAVDDATLHGEVALALDKAGLDIVGRAVSVKDGAVTLRGLAPAGQGEQAERVAAGVPGVRRVHNKIRLLLSEESADPDEALAARVLAALGRNHHTAIATLGVIAHEGKVTISGPVASIEGQNAITRIASTVPGVRSLDNQTVLKDVTSVRSDDKGIHRHRAR
ncbi:MAG TPA: BON domain-containing protein [Chloroflexota bacterium]|nr:BON domain-containing protein [Chloroflexota bacterium]